MPSAVPRSKATALIDSLVAEYRSGRRNDFEIGRVAQEAKRLMHSDAPAAHTVLGSVAALRGESDNMREHYRIAMSLVEYHDIRLNFAVSLSILERHKEALEAAIDALDRYPDSPALLRLAITAAVESGCFGRANSLCDQLEATGSEHASLDATRKLGAAVCEGAFGEAGARELLGLLALVQRDERVWTKTAVVHAQAPDVFFYERFVFATHTAAAEMNERLADEVAKRPNLREDPGLNFVAAFTGVASNAGHT